MKQKVNLLITAITLVAALLVTLTSCGQLAGSGESKVTVNLPYVSRSARALSDEVNSRLKSEHSSYRVHMNDRVLEGTGGSFSASFAVGLKVDVFIESLNSKGEVIVRTATKSIVVKNGENVVTLDMKADGNEVTRPTPAPQPVTGRVTYANGGDYVSGTPTDNTSYGENADVPLSATEPTRPGYKFNGWTATVELICQNASGSPGTIPVGTPFVSASSSITSSPTKITSFTMPTGGVVLTAQWSPITYTVNFNGDGNTGGSENQITFTVEDAGTGRTFPSTTGFTKTENRFSHWSTSSNGTSILLDYIISQLKMGNTVSGLTIGSNDDITIYAVWESIYRELSEAVVGDVICANGKVLSANDITIELQSKTIAIVYKVDTSEKQVWAVGKMLSSNTMEWAINSAEGYNQNITSLQEEQGYTDGSTGLAKLIAVTSDAETELATKYPAWDYACNYGTNSATNADIPANMQSGWYLPSEQELEEVYDNRDAINTALAKTGVSKTSFGSGNATYYWSSSLSSSFATLTYFFNFGSGSGSYCNRDDHSYVCAVRQFMW